MIMKSISNTEIFFDLNLESTVLKNENILIKAQLSAHKNTNCKADNNAHTKRIFTVLFLSEYINAVTVVIAASIQKSCQKK